MINRNWATPEDAEAYLQDLMLHGKAWSMIMPDGKVRRVDPDEYRLPSPKVTDHLDTPPAQA